MSVLPFTKPDISVKLLELAKKSYRPKEILELNEAIEGEIRAAELNLSITGVIDDERIQKIVKMKLKKDSLYIAWAEGKIS